VLLLLRDCLPLFVATFLLQYISNAPRYAIDALMTDSAQAIYGFIAMPIFVVTLLVSFIFNPMIAGLSGDWAGGRVAHFKGVFKKLMGWVAVITAACVLAAWLLGVPVLGLLYNTDVAPYLIELCVLVAAGGLLALATLFTTGVTILRRQNSLILGYVAVALAALVSSSFLVAGAGIAGASWGLLLMMAALAVWFGLTFVYWVRRDAKNADKGVDAQ
jgi:O-antigen/teichoic acid export membrane protein